MQEEMDMKLLFGDKNLQLVVVMVVPLCDYTKTTKLYNIKVNFMVSELYTIYLYIQIKPLFKKHKEKKQIKSNYINIRQRRTTCVIKV